MCDTQQFDSEIYWAEQFGRQRDWQLQPDVLLLRLQNLERRVNQLEQIVIGGTPEWAEGA